MSTYYAPGNVCDARGTRMLMVNFARLTSRGVLRLNISRCVYGVFMDEISIWIGEFSREGDPPQRGGIIQIHPEPEAKGRKEVFALLFLPHCLGWGISSHLLSSEWVLTPSDALVLRLTDLDWIIPPAILGPWLADGRSWNFSASIIAEANTL